MSFNFLNSVFCRAEVFNFNEVQFINFFLLWLMLWVSYLKTLPNPRSQGFNPEFLSMSFIVLAFTFRSVIHFDKFCIWCEVEL